MKNPKQYLLSYLYNNKRNVMHRSDPRGQMWVCNTLLEPPWLKNPPFKDFFVHTRRTPAVRENVFFTT